MNDTLNIIFQELIKSTPVKKHRFLFDEFDLKDRLTGLVGPRGAGKTTLLLQYIKANFGPGEAFYVSADHIYFTQNTLYEFVTQLYMDEGIKTFFIDEIHKYKNWNQELKNLHDGFPQMTVVFSGSSSLDIVKGNYDLSRRAVLKRLPGMSFREYLNLSGDQNYPVVPLEKILSNPTKAASFIDNIPTIKKHFSNYLSHGFYPFYYEQPLSYNEKLLAILDKTIFEDIAEFYKLKTGSLHLLRKLLLYLASVPPGKVTTHNLAKNLSVDDKTVLSFLVQLEETGLIRLIYPAEPGNALLSRPEKIFLSNTNLQYALEGKIKTDLEIGSVRELFFIQSLKSANYAVFHSKVGDYEVDGAIFEIGGKNKTAKQIAGKEKSFLVKDDIYTAKAREIPLWYFGFLY